MPNDPSTHDSHPTDALLLVSVGNTRTRYARVESGQLQPSACFDNSSVAGLLEAVAKAAGVDPLGVAVVGAGPAGEVRPGPSAVATVVIASVNDPVANQIEARLAQSTLQGKGAEILRFGRDLEVPIRHTLTPPLTVGQDRLLTALGAFARAKEACVVIDAGTAVTVDFVDGDGTFHGGAIAPGLFMMRDALHQGTAALPFAEITPSNLPGGGVGTTGVGIDEEEDEDGDTEEQVTVGAPAAPPFGKTTVEAINVGVTSAVIGMAHLLIDRYAQFYGAYPRVIATGGAAALLFEHDELIEHIIPDLPLMGMLTAWQVREAGIDLDEDEEE